MKKMHDINQTNDVKTHRASTTFQVHKMMK